MTDALATHYARALADAVFAPGSGLKPEEAVRQLRDAEAAISGSADLQKALLSPAVTKSRKRAVVAELAGQAGLDRLIRNFLLVAITHRRTRELGKMRAEFERVVDERLGWIPADIASAQELTADQRERIEGALGARLGKHIRAHYRTDPALLGGVRARVASKEYDATLRGKLESMGRRLAGSL
jgi:F-type H+-transporting ATPase subunit delta